ncbi:MAG: hypothetical protein WC003_07860 [Terrimicrobiaceae bacterium]
MNKLFHLPCALVAAIWLVPQCAAETPPTTHEVHFPKGDAAWSVAFENQAAPASKPTGGAAPETIPTRTVKVDIVRQGNLRRDVVTLSDGSTRGIWWIRNPPVALFDNGPRISTAMASSMAQQRYDESSFDWVGANAFAGMKPCKGKPCQYYEMEVVDEMDGTKHTRRAWIDPETHQPVALDDSFIKVTFAFQDAAPTEPLRMPDNFLDKYKRVQAFYAPPRRAGN